MASDFSYGFWRLYARHRPRPEFLQHQGRNDHGCIDVNQEGLKYLSEELSKLKLTTIPSVGNFISFNGQFNGKKLFEALLRKGIIVRQIDLYDMPDFIRVTVGTMEQNQVFVSALKELL